MNRRLIRGILLLHWSQSWEDLKKPGGFLGLNRILGNKLGLWGINQVFNNSLSAQVSTSFSLEGVCILCFHVCQNSAVFCDFNSVAFLFPLNNLQFIFIFSCIIRKCFLFLSGHMFSNLLKST